MTTKPFRLGIECLLQDQAATLKTAAIGLVSHAAARLPDGRTTAEALQDRVGRRLQALFGPEHGFSVRGAAGEPVLHQRHPQWDIPVWSLYGAQRRPTLEMLRGLDLLIVDLQSLPFRPYTYLASLRLVMEAAGEFGVPVWVLDRPAPLPSTLDGAMPAAEQAGFVCPAALPMAYGMTIAETARWLQAQLAHPPELRVIAMQGYRRDPWLRPDAPPWTPPSPAIRDWSSALCYLITVFCEALPLFTNDRHGPLAFQVLYGPPAWGDACRAELTAAFGVGTGFQMTPAPPEAGTRRPGFRISVTDPERLQPVAAAVRILGATQQALGIERMWRHPGARPDFFDRLFGTQSLRERLQAGVAPETIIADWAPAMLPFRRDRQAVLLYPERRPTRGLVRRCDPRRALVLAAGLGRRMQPLSMDLPKPVMPFWNQPLLEHILRRLRAWGITDVLINLHHGADTVLRVARAIRPPGMRLTFSFEPVLMDTGGALTRAAWFMGDDPLWIVNADIVFDFQPEVMLRAMRPPAPLAVLWMHPDAGPRTVALDSDGRVRDFAVTEPGAPGTFTFCGVHCVSPRILEFIPADAPSSIIDAYRRAMAAGHAIKGVVIPRSKWIDLGTPAAYLAAHRDHRPRSVPRTAGLPRLPLPGAPADALEEHVVRGARTVIGPGCRLTDCVLWDDVRLLAGTTVSHTIIGRGVTVGGRIDRPTVALGRLGRPDFARIVEAIGWPVARTAVTPLAPRGSGRSFYRIRWGRRTAILVHEDGSRRENRYYMAQSDFLRNLGLPVPAVMAYDASARLGVLADGGDRTLSDAVSDLSHAAWMRRYRDVLAVMARWHILGAQQARSARLPLMPRFTPGLFAWELDYFTEHCLRGHYRTPAATVAVILRELRAATRPVRKLPQVLIHRDLQSSNILLPAKSLLIIDFQGMRYGPALYDLASLLYDPYVAIDPVDRLELLAFYRREFVRGAEVPCRSAILNGADPAACADFADGLHRAALQRLAQALGAYARLGSVPATRRFLQHIPAALQHLRQAAERVGALPALCAWLDQRI